MNKQQIRSVINAVANLNLTDIQALRFIKDFAGNQIFKSPRAYENFCTNCGIFYTSSMSTMMRNVQRGMSSDEIREWNKWFIEECSYFKMIVRGK